MARVSETKITNEALAMVREGGIKNLGLNALAKRLGVTPPALYKHFKGLTDIKRTISLTALKMLKQTLSQSAIGVSEREALTALAQAYRKFAKEHTAEFQFTTVAPPEADEEWQLAAYEVVKVVALTLKGYQLGADDTIHAVRSLRSALTGFVTLEIENGFGLKQSIDESFSRLIEILADGIEAGQRRFDKQTRGR